MKNKPVDTSKGVMVIKKEIAPIVAIAIKMLIDSPKQMESAADLLSRLNRFSDKITEEKEKVTKPLLQALSAERGRWKPIEQMYDEGIASLREKMGDYQTEMIRVKEEEEAKIAARVGDGRGKFKIETAVKKINEIDAPETKVVSENGMIKFRKVQQLKITDETKIPRKYFVVDENAVVAALKAGITVEGAQLEDKQIPVNFR